MKAADPAVPVLLVDDHPPNLVALEGILHGLPVQPLKAVSGERALQVLLHQDVAAVLLDVQMPGLDGFQTASLIKQVERTRHIPILFLSALSRDSEHVVQGYRSGAVDYLVKPYEPAALLAKMALFIELFRLRQSRRSAQALKPPLAAARSATTILEGLVHEGEARTQTGVLKAALGEADRVASELGG